MPAHRQGFLPSRGGGSHPLPSPGRGLLVSPSSSSPAQVRAEPAHAPHFCPQPPHQQADPGRPQG